MDNTKNMNPKERYEHLIATSKSELSVSLVSETKPGEYEHLNACVDLVMWELAEFLADYDQDEWPSLLAELRAPSASTEPRIIEFSKRHAERAGLATFKPWAPRLVLPAQGGAQGLVLGRKITAVHNER